MSLTSFCHWSQLCKAKCFFLLPHPTSTCCLPFCVSGHLSLACLRLKALACTTISNRGKKNLVALLHPHYHSAYIFLPVPYAKSSLSPRSRWGWATACTTARVRGHQTQLCLACLRQARCTGQVPMSSPRTSAGDRHSGTLNAHLGVIQHGAHNPVCALGPHPAPPLQRDLLPYLSHKCKD